MRNHLHPHLAAAALALALIGAPVWAVTSPQPKWSALSPARQAALEPLKSEWDKLPNNRKLKWIGVADKLPTMKPDEQLRIRKNMAHWAKLTPDQRRVARENYQTLKEVPPAQKKELHQAYQKLPDQQKQSLTRDAEKAAAKGTRQAKVSPADNVKNGAGLDSSGSVAAPSGGR